MRRLLLIVFILLLSAAAQAQLPVSQEPKHPVVFENNKVRLLNARLVPGDSTQYHVHSTPSVFIFFTKTTTRSQLITQQPYEGTSIAGTVLYENLAAPNIRIHRVWNVDTSVFHVMDIELLSSSKERLNTKVLMSPHARLKIDTPGVRTYNIDLNKNERFNISKTQSGFVLVSLKKGQVQLAKEHKKNIVDIEEGQFYWIDPREKFSIQNMELAAANFVLLEIN